ncbi:MAG: glycosyltransferase family 1 protein [bacterium]|nr:glycosyltransferase family 1 protein [bacterium]
MTIGIDCRLYGLRHGGIGRYLAELVGNLSLLDQSNHYILYFNEPEFSQFSVPNGHWQKKLVNIPHYSLDEQTRFCHFLNREPVDLIHFPHFNAPIWYRRPFVVTIHDLTLHLFPHKSYVPKWTLKKMIHVFAYRLITRMVTRHAKKVIAVSQSTKSDLQHQLRLDPEKIIVVYEGAPEHFQRSSDSEIQSVLKKFSIGKPYLLYTGVWRSHKNLLNLIQAFVKVRASGRDIQLVLAGKKDPSCPEVPCLISRLKLESDVILTGFVEDAELVALYSGTSAFVFPSLYEGFGLPPLEAMKLGVPVLCSNRSSLPEVCADAALYFDPSRPEDIAAKITQLLGDPQLAEQLTQRGTQNLTRFSWKGMAGQILDLYNKVI